MMLTKQDQIQSTLHGDTSVYQSPSSSVLSGAVSPPLTSPTTGLRAFPSVLPTRLPESASDITSDFDLESFLSMDLFPPVDVNNPVAESPVSTRFEAGDSASISLIAGQPQLGATAGQLQLGATAGQPDLGATGQPLQSGATEGQTQLGATAQLLQLGATAQPLQLGATAQPLRLGGIAGPPKLRTVTAARGLPQLGDITGSPHVGSTAGQLKLEALTRSPQQQCVDPVEILHLPEFAVLNDANVGKFARALASRSLFGDDVLQRSTLRGDTKRGLQMLDKTKLYQLFAIVHRHPSFSNYSKVEFDTLVKKKILPSITHLCKELRR